MFTNLAIMEYWRHAAWCGIVLAFGSLLSYMDDRYLKKRRFAALDKCFSWLEKHRFFGRFAIGSSALISFFLVTLAISRLTELVLTPPDPKIPPPERSARSNVDQPASAQSSNPDVTVGILDAANHVANIKIERAVSAFERQPPPVPFVGRTFEPVQVRAIVPPVPQMTVGPAATAPRAQAQPPSAQSQVQIKSNVSRNATANQTVAIESDGVASTRSGVTNNTFSGKISDSFNGSPAIGPINNGNLPTGNVYGPANPIAGSVPNPSFSAGGMVTTVPITVVPHGK